MRRLLSALVFAALLATACSEPTSSPETSSPGAGTTVSTPPDAVETTMPEDDFVPRCRDIELPTADPGYYDNTPKYVGNEMPVDEVRQWASQYPEFVEVWIDREPTVEVTFEGETVVYEPGTPECPGS